MTDTHTRPSRPVLCFVISQPSLCTHGQHLFTASLHVFLLPMQLIEPLLPFHPDSLFPASPSLSVYLPALPNLLPTTHKKVFLSWTHERQIKMLKRHCRHGYIDFKLLLLGEAPNPHTPNFVSVEKTPCKLVSTTSFSLNMSSL